MSELRVNNITNRDGKTGTVVAGIPQVTSTSYFVPPSGKTGQRYVYVDGGENIVRDGLFLHLDAKYSYPSTTGITTSTASLDSVVYDWYDMSGNYNHGLLESNASTSGGPSYSSSDGGSLVFDGTNDYIRMSYPPSFFKNYTLSCWFKISSLDTFSLISYGSENTSERRSLFVWNGGSGSNYRLVSSTYASNIFGDTTLSTNTWYNAAVSLSNTAEAKIYLNGVLDGTGTNTLATPTSNVLFVGKTGSVDEELHGNMAQVTIYDRALTAAEVLQNYNALKDRFGL